jgi:hypothetical protein
MELIEQLMQALGVDKDQATGGASLLLKMAKEKLGSGDFGKISELIPDVDELLSKAPEGGGDGLLGAIGGIASKLGGSAGNLGHLAEVAGAFKGLGLDPQMVQKFAGVIMDFLQEKGGDTVKGVLEGVLSAK